MERLPFSNGRPDLLPYPRLESSPISMSSDRRAFLSKVMATVISIDVLSPSIAEASVTESTYGVKKPKKQGGLANKVKAVGKILDGKNSLMSNSLTLFIICDSLINTLHY